MIAEIKKVVRNTLDFKKDIVHRVRIKKSVTKIFGYENSVNKEYINVITTYKCNRGCLDCSQNCSQAPTAEKMSFSQIEKFLSQTKAFKFKKIFITGGESLLEKDIIKTLEKIRKNFSEKTKIILITNGFGKIVLNRIKQVPKEIIVRNTNKQTNVFEKFVSINNSPIDYQEYSNADFKNGCFVLKKCGISLTRYGFYACPNAGAIDRVVGLDIGRKKLKKNDQMRDQLEKLCPYCGFFLYKNYKNNKPGLISPTMTKLFANYRNKKPKMTLY